MQQLSTISTKKLFLIDGTGAMVSALLLSLVLANFEAFFGMPKFVLYILSLIAFAFSLNSFANFITIPANPAIRLKLVAIANAAYCCLVAGLLIYYYQQLTLYGLLYFVAEKTIVLVLVYIELKTAAATAH
jgi:hypothetical protein